MRNLLFKHTGIIHNYNPKITLLEKKLSNILLMNAFSALKTQDIFTITLKEIEQKLRLVRGGNSRLNILGAFHKLMMNPTDWNIFTKDNKNKWGGAAALADYEIDLDTGEIEYSYSPKMRQKLSTPNIFARINLDVQNRFTSKYSLILWEYLIEHLCSGQTANSSETIELSKLKKLFGIDEKIAYDGFKEINRRILNEVVQEINDLSDIQVSYNLIKEGNTVVSVTFDVTAKEEFIRFSPNVKELFGSLTDKEEATPIVLKEKTELQTEQRCPEIQPEPDPEVAPLPTQSAPRDQKWYQLLRQINQFYSNDRDRFWISKVIYNSYDDSSQTLGITVANVAIASQIKNQYGYHIFRLARIVWPEIRDIAIYDHDRRQMYRKFYYK